jgi:hypothetical protein
MKAEEGSTSVNAEASTESNEAAAEPDFALELLPQHRKLIEDSAIRHNVAIARGYRSITRRAELERLGFARSQQNVPALLIPIWGVTGEVVNYQSRPDEPRIREGKRVKYETPAKSRMALDVHPHARQWLNDISRPLFFTEGSRKGDAAVSSGLCCIALLGVWNWRGRSDGDGIAALADWELIALKDREVYIAFDSDVMRKRQVRAALRRLRAFLELRGARVNTTYFPCHEGGAKVGLDDFFASGKTVDDLLACSTTELLDEAEDKATYAPYSETEQGLVWHKETAQGAETVLLTNFHARVIADVLEDDGTETHRMFEVETKLAEQSGESVRDMITASEFSAMRWPVSLLGPQAIIFPNKSEHARCGIQSLSTDICKRRVYTHTGWREVNGEWVYLHGGGAIGASGAQIFDVKLPNALEPFNLPAPPEGEKLQEAIRASLRILQVASWHITVPVLGAAWSAVLGGTDFTVQVTGESGTGKTVLTAIIQAFFGAGFSTDNLPASWSSTGNALEGLAHVAKDALLVVDDFAPTGTSQDMARMHREADRILRAQGNRSGRGRMRVDGSLRPNKPPRGLILSTGEDVPKGQSLGARQLLVEMNKDSLDWKAISECQRAAREGVYARAMAAYICWLAHDYKNIRDRMAEEVARIRELAARSVAGHKRTPTTVAHLMRGWLYFLKAAVSYGALGEDEAKEFVESIWKVLGEVATR